MTDKKQKEITMDDFAELLDKNPVNIPQTGEIIRGKVLSASKSEVKIDINGELIGVVRGPELYEEDDEYANLVSGSEVEATVIDDENENGQLELSFRIAGQERAWKALRDAVANKSIVKVKVIDANKGGLLVNFKQVPGFLPVSQLAPENYPRINGGDKGKILEKLRSFAGDEFEVKIITLDEKEDKIIFSEKEAWNELQSDIISKYKVGTVVEGNITAVTDFGVFISFGESLEGLIHISELAWQRIENPADIYKVGDKIKAEVINLDGSKIFLSSKKLMDDPWEGVEKKYKKGQIIKAKILKVNPFGLFVELDKDIHGLAHITQVGLAPGQKIHEAYKTGEEKEFEIVSIEPAEHRLGVAIYFGKKDSKKDEKSEDKKKDSQEEKKKVNKKEEKKKDTKLADKEEKISKKKVKEKKEKTE